MKSKITPKWIAFTIVIIGTFMGVGMGFQLSTKYLAFPLQKCCFWCFKRNATSKSKKRAKFAVNVWSFVHKSFHVCVCMYVCMYVCIRFILFCVILQTIEHTIKHTIKHTTHTHTHIICKPCVKTNKKRCVESHVWAPASVFNDCSSTFTNTFECSNHYSGCK